MSAFEMACILLAGIGAGIINTIVGSGTLITFPTLLIFGIPPVTANISNTIGLVPGSVTATLGYRGEMVGAGPDLRRLAPLSLLGGVCGGLLLLVLDPAAFRAIVPVLIAVGLALVILGPRLSRRSAGLAVETAIPHGRRGAALGAGVFGAGIYGGYFGAAQGVILMGLLGALTAQPLQRLTGYKNVLAAIVNTVAAILFIVVAGNQIDWRVVGLIAIGSTIGSLIGARVGRRLSPTVLRSVIVVVGVAAIIKVLAFP